MPWWGWLLIGAAGAGLVILVLWLLFRKKGGAAVDRVALLESERKRAQEDLEAERQAHARTEAVRKELEAELRGIAERKKARLEALDEEARKKLRDLTDDPDALLARVDEILGGGAGGG